MRPGSGWAESEEWSQACGYDVPPESDTARWPEAGAIHRGQMWLMLDQQNTFLVAQYYRQIEQVLFWLSLCFGYSQAEAD